MTDVEQAAANNAGWCAAVARSHGVDGALGERAWTAARRTPPLYPDAVTLHPTATVDDVVPCIDDGPGCSIKDSFRSLDLAPLGFDVLFDATWMLVPPVDDGVDSSWESVTTHEQFSAWTAAWMAAGGLAGVFVGTLLAEPGVAFVHDGACSSGAAFFAGAGVVGITNVFGPPDAFANAVAAARRLHPSAPLVAYGPGQPNDTARRLGFEPIGDLRIWHKPD